MRLASLSRVVDARPLFQHSATFRSRSTQGPIRKLIPLIPTRVRRLHAKHFHKHQPQLSLSTPRRCCSLIPAVASTQTRSTAPLLPQRMSLVAGPGRGGFSQLPAELQLCAQKHVDYIQSLDTVRRHYPSIACLLLTADTAQG